MSLNGRVPHGLVREPVNEAGVVFFFGMVAHLLGFDVEALQGAYPDGEAKLEAEPGRWQNIRSEAAPGRTSPSGRRGQPT
ncbi:MAG TPA: hypothetical protein VFW31_12300 [Candidatus Angelobacter sp.]|nr:hypothetical protein [Candidatus Angelobacter sp.]